MKRLLHSFIALALILVYNVNAHAQNLYLNELQTDPSASPARQEYFELFNSSSTSLNADCYSLVSYFNDGVKRGFYVVDLPNVNVPAKSFLLASSQGVFTTTNGSVTADFSWNAAGRIKRYVYSGSNLVLDATGAPYTNIFMPSKGTLTTQNPVYAVFLFKSNTLIDAFIGGQNSITVPSFISGSLAHTSADGACGNLTYNFTNINSEQSSKFAYASSLAETNIGYVRRGNGPCTTNVNWQKALCDKDHTPGFMNADCATACTTTPAEGCKISQGCFDFIYKGYTENANNTVTIRFVIKTNCDYDLSYAAFQLPAGATAISPISNYSANYNYTVENATNEPFHSIKFNGKGISGYKNGVSDEFVYTITKAQFASMSTISVEAKAGTIVNTVTFDKNCSTSCKSLSVSGYCTPDKMFVTVSGSLDYNVYPVKATLYADKNNNGRIDDGEKEIGTATLTSAGTASIVRLTNDEKVIILVTSQNTCYIKYGSMTCRPDNPLPVKFSAFSVAREKQMVVAKWQTATEQNNKGFNVQRNTNGSWITVGYVASKGENSNSVLDYEFTDVNAERGTSQYRIQQVDLDGKVSYSEVRTVKGLEQGAQVIIYPNPTNNGRFTIVFENTSGTNDVIIADGSGRVVKQYRSVAGSTIVVSGLTSGFYSVQITNKVTAEKTIAKVIVK